MSCFVVALIELCLCLLTCLIVYAGEMGLREKEGRLMTVHLFRYPCIKRVRIGDGTRT